MRREQLLAIVAIVPLALVASVVTGRDAVVEWMERDPVVVGEAGQDGTVVAGEGTMAFGDARIVDGSSAVADGADVPDGGQVLIVPIRLRDQTDPDVRCDVRLDGRVGDVDGAWLPDPVSDTPCSSDGASTTGTAIFVVPAGAAKGVALLVQVDGAWTRVPLDPST